MPRRRLEKHGRPVSPRSESLQRQFAHGQVQSLQHFAHHQRCVRPAHTGPLPARLRCAAACRAGRSASSAEMTARVCPVACTRVIRPAEGGLACVHRPHGGTTAVAARTRCPDPAPAGCSPAARCTGSQIARRSWAFNCLTVKSGMPPLRSRRTKAAWPAGIRAGSRQSRGHPETPPGSPATGCSRESARGCSAVHPPATAPRTLRTPNSYRCKRSTTAATARPHSASNWACAACWLTSLWKCAARPRAPARSPNVAAAGCGCAGGVHASRLQRGRTAVRRDFLGTRLRTRRGPHRPTTTGAPPAATRPL